MSFRHYASKRADGWRFGFDARCMGSDEIFVSRGGPYRSEELAEAHMEAFLDKQQQATTKEGE